MSLAPIWQSLPKFVVSAKHFGPDGIADDRSYVIHCHEPRFVMEFVPGREGEVLLIDDAGQEEISKLKDEARHYFDERRDNSRELS